MRRFLSFLFPAVLFDEAGDAGAGAPVGGETPPAAPAAPAAAPEPAPDPMGAGDAAMRARVLGAEDPNALAPDDMPYRDAKALRDEVAAVRRQYGAVAQLPPEVQGELLRWAPAGQLAAADATLMPDVALLTSAYPSLPADDQAVVDGILASARQDPAGAAAALREAAAILREPVTPEGAPGTPGTDAFGFAPDDPERPVTAAQAAALAEQRMAEMLDQREYAAEHSRQTDAILTEARDLGYSPDSTDPLERLRFKALIAAATDNPDGGLAAANELLGQLNQRTVDQYVEGKLRDAGRPQLPANGATPSGERRLESMDDMGQAMRERLAARGFQTRQPTS